MTILLISILSLSILYNIVLYVNRNNHLKELSKIKDDLTKKLSNINKKMICNKGFIDVNTTASKSTEKWVTRVMVEEVERYTNGYSKLELIDIQVISGPGGRADDVIKYVRNTFSNLEITKDVTWLVPEEDVTEIRKKKLKSLLDDVNKL